MQSLMRNDAFALHLGKESGCGASLPVRAAQRRGVGLETPGVSAELSDDVARRRRPGFKSDHGAAGPRQGISLPSRDEAAPQLVVQAGAGLETVAVRTTPSKKYRDAA
jgi:hypothetical protein